MSRLFNATMFFGVVAVIGMNSSSPQPAPVAAAEKPDTARKAVADSSLARFDGGERLLVAMCGNQWRRAVNDSTCGNGLRVLIVSVPDPYDSRLDWSFDQEVEAVRRAVEASGYVIDRFDLPGAADSVVAKGLTFTFSGKKVARRTVDPGVILFRPTRLNDAPLLLVYLVGEVPTYGIYKDAMTRALDERAALLGSCEPPSCDPKKQMPVHTVDDKVGIAGPVFSGSVPSLKLVLKDRHEEIAVISGSATSPGNEAALTAGSPNISFRTTINTDDALDWVLTRRVLPTLLRKGDAVAILCDCSTAYQPGTPDQEPDTADIRIIQISFPANIAGFRAQYQKPKAPPSDPKTAPLTTQGDRVNLDLNKLSRAEETPRAVSEATPAAVDLVMREILSTLRRNNVRAVVLHATDVRDKLFLAQVIRQELKDVQLITYESNVLFQRDEFQGALRGMVVLSSYPLVLENQDWTNGNRQQRLAFASETTQGTYNAVAMLLGRSDLVFEYGRPMSFRGKQAPPVWITVIGNNSILPVSVDSTSSASAATIETKRLQHDPHHTNLLWVLILLTTLTISVFVSIGAILDAQRTMKGERKTRMDRRTGKPVPLVYPDLYAFLGLVAVLAFSGPITVLVVRYSTTFLHRTLIIAMSVASVFWISAIVWTMRALLKGEKRRLRDLINDTFEYISRETESLDVGGWRWLEIGARALLIVAGGVLLALVGLSMLELIQLTRSNFAIFAYRALQIDSGVSPMLPIMLMAAGLYTWCVWHRGRVRELREGTAFEQMIIQSHDDQMKDATGRGMSLIRQSVAQARDRLVLILPVRATGLLVAIVLVIVCTWLMFNTRGSIERLVFRNGRIPLSESVAFDFMMRAAVISMLCVGTWAVLRLIATWKSLQRMMAGLAETPLAWSLASQPLAVKERVRPTLIALAKSKRALGHCANVQWREMVAAAKTVGGRKDETRLIEVVRELPTPDAWWTPGREAEDMGEELVKVTAALESFWAEEPGHGGWDPKDEAARKRYFEWPLSEPLKSWRKHAEEFVAGQSVYYIEWAQAQLRRMSYFLLASLVISIGLVASYPFQPQSMVQVLLGVLIVSAMGSIIFITGQMNRDPVLSALAGSDAGVINWNRDFLLNIVLYVVVPALTLLSAKFPVVRDVVFAWAEPLLRNLAKF